MGMLMMLFTLRCVRGRRTSAVFLAIRSLSSTSKVPNLGAKKEKLWQEGRGAGHCNGSGNDGVRRNGAIRRR